MPPVTLRSLSVVALAGLLAPAFWVSGAFAYPGPFVPGTTQSFTTRANPRSVAVGDVNNDGILDMVVSASSGFSVHLGQGGGVFAPKVDYGTSGALGNVVLTDLNGDGKLDMAAPFRHATLPGIVVLTGNGDGTFGPVNLFSGPANADFMVKADFNHDGRMDVAICGYATTAGTATVYLTGTPAIPGGVPNFTSTNYAVGNRPQGIAAGNLKTSVTFPDLVTANTTVGTISILKNDGTGHFGSRQDIAVKGGSWAVAVGSIEGFAKQQIATASKDSATVSYLTSNTGATWSRNDFPTAAGPRDVQIADTDGDGTPEVVVAATAANVISILALNWDPNTYQPPTALLPKNDIATGNAPTSVTVTNFNGDLKNDLLSANSTAASVNWTPCLVQNGWSYGDNMPDNFSAPNQAGDLTNFSGVRAGKWVLLDICSSWCLPCRAMAEHTQDLYLRWAGNPNVQFEYVTALVDGRTPGVPSTIYDAMAWANTFHINRPILHSAGSPSGGARNLASISSLTATPSLRLIDPQGRIVWFREGAVEDSTITRVLANAAGVAIPPPPDASVGTGFANATMAVFHGNQAISEPWDPDIWDFPFYQDNPGFGDNLIGYATASRDASGLETWTLTLRYNEVGLSNAPYGPLPTDDSWKFSLSNMALDALDRVPQNGSLATVTVKDTIPNANSQKYDAQVLIPYTWSNAGTFTMDPIPADKLAELPPIREVAVVWTLKVGNIVTGIGDSGKAAHVSLRAPFPNPARGEARLSWSQPVAGAAKLELYDVRGRLVKTLSNRAQPAGEHAARWDLTNEAGARVGAGLYFARVAVEGVGMATARLTVLR